MGIQTVVQNALTEVGVPVSNPVRLGKRSSRQSEDDEIPPTFTARRRVFQQASVHRSTVKSPAEIFCQQRLIIEDDSEELMFRLRMLSLRSLIIVS
jgi:hypothetical protein